MTSAEIAAYVRASNEAQQANAKLAESTKTSAAAVTSATGAFDKHVASLRTMGAEAAAAARLGVPLQTYMDSMPARQANFANGFTGLGRQIAATTAATRTSAIGIAALGSAAAATSGGGIAALGKAQTAAAASAVQHTNFVKGLTSLLFGPFTQSLNAGGNAARGASKANEEHSQSLRSVGSSLMENVGKFVAWLAVITAGYLSAKTVIGQFMAAMEQASKMEDLQFALVATIGNAEKAQTVFNEIRGMSPVFTDEQWGKAALSLLNVGISAEKVKEKLEQMGNIAAAQGKPLEMISEAYLRAVEQGRVTYQQMNTFAQGGISLWPQLAAVMGKSQTEVAKIARTTGIDIKYLDEALKRATSSGGAFAGVLEARGNLMSTQVKALRKEWDDLLYAFGKPIAESSKQPLMELVEIIHAAAPAAERFGQKISDALSIFNEWLRDANKWELLYAGWQVVIDRMSNYFRETLTQARVDFMRGFLLANEAPTNPFGAAVAGALSAAGDAVEQHIREATALTDEEVKKQQQHLDKLYQLQSGYASLKGILEGIAAVPLPAIATLGTDLNAYPGAPTSWSSTAGLGPQQPAVEGLSLGPAFKPAPDFGLRGHPPIAPTSPGIRDATGGGRQSEWDRFKTDSDIINKYWQDYSIIMAKSTSATETQRRIEELTVSVSQRLYDPKLLAPFAKGLDALILKEAEHNKAMQAMELRIRVGAASIGDSFKFGIQKALDSIGTLQQQIANLGEQMVNTIGSGFANALTDVITGAKSAKDAFKEMAVSILRDITRMIIQMLIFRAISAAFGAAGVAIPTAQYASAIGPGIGPGMARGGHTRDRAHTATLGEEGTEFVFNAKATRNMGIENLYALQASAEKGRVTQSAAQGQRLPAGFDVGEVPGNIEPGPLAGGILGTPRIGPSGGGITSDPGSTTTNPPGSLLPLPGMPHGAIGDSSEWITRNPDPGYSGEVYFPGYGQPDETTTSDVYDPGADFNPDPGYSGESTVDPGSQGTRGFVGYGTTPFAGYTGAPSLYSTTWSYEPGLGYVPRAQPAGAGGPEHAFGGQYNPNTGGTDAVGGAIARYGGSDGSAQVSLQGQAKYLHSGGVVGLDGRSASFPMDVFESLFANARRYHSGGVIGSDEEAIIAQKGEVITPRGGGRNVSIGNINITVGGGGGGGSRSESNKISDTEAKQLVDLMTATVDKWANKNQRSGGILYKNRAQR